MTLTRYRPIRKMVCEWGHEQDGPRDVWQEGRADILGRENAQHRDSVKIRPGNR